jgi:hypothetical protein
MDTAAPAWIWNWRWDCGSDASPPSSPLEDDGCTACNTSISIRILSPGDDGDVFQVNSAAATSVVENVFSAQQTVLEALAPTLVPLATSPPSTSAGRPFVMPVEAQLLQSPAVPVAAAPSEPATPAESSAEAAPPAASDEAATAPTPAPAAGTQHATAARAGDIEPISPAFPTVAGRPDPAAGPDGLKTIAPKAPSAKGAAVPLVGQAATPQLTFAVPAATALRTVPVATTPSAATAATTSTGASAASEPTSGAQLPAVPKGPRLPLESGSTLAASSSGQGGSLLTSATAAIAGALLFLASGLAQWLWAGAERRPRGLRAGRPERPG